MSANIIELHADNFEQEVIASPLPVCIDFWAPWCGPCLMIAPILEEIAQKRPELQVCKVNVDEEDALAKQYQIGSIPTLLVVKEGRITARSSGLISESEILKLL